MKSIAKKISQVRDVKRIVVACFLIGAAALIGGPVLQRQATYVHASSPHGATTGQNATLPMGPFSSQAVQTAATNPQDPGIVTGSSKLPAASSPKVGHSEKNDTSPALRSMRVIPPTRHTQESDNENPVTLLPGSGVKVKDPVQQTSFGPGTPAMPNPLLSFDGISYATGGAGWPPDTNGAAGLNNYIQMVNSSFSIWNKSGVALYGPASINTLWQGFGGYCETHNSGDPIVMYDRFATRWVMTQFAVGPAPNHTPSYECIAVSASDDPFGGWYRYAYHLSDTVMYDYPKFGSWLFGYFMSANLFGPAGTQPQAAIAFDRSQMIVGNPGSYIEFDTNAGSTLLPADMDGNTLPPVGSPEYFLSLYGSTLAIWKFHADFQQPGNSSLTGNLVNNVAPYNPTICGAQDGNCIPEPETGIMLESASERLMNRLAYRNFGDHESLVVNHTVRTDSGYAGIRWYEIRTPNTNPTVYQQSTLAIPDNNYRWLGSIAQDREGNIALGYSISGYYPIYPSIGYAGRLATDPPGQLTQGENILTRGGGSQLNYSRWGDYSSMAIDPYDDCTFWYTTEYYQTTSTNWHTRVGTFKYPTCGQPRTATPTRTATATATATNTSTPSATATPPSCGPLSNYTIAQGTATIVPGITLLPGSQCDDCVAGITLPFPYTLYNQTFTSATVSSNGQLGFVSADTEYDPTCLPYAGASYAIFPHWDDMDTSAPGSGIFTSISGTAPNRIFNIQWIGQYFGLPAPNVVNFEVRLYEGQSRFDIIYGQVDRAGASATIGVQRGTGENVTQFSCNTAGITNGLRLSFTQSPCGTFTPTVTPTSAPYTPTSTFTRTSTATSTPTSTATSTNTPIPTNTLMPTITPIRTATPAGLLVGHTTWQGIAQPDARNVGITGTLKLCVGGVAQTYVAATDASGTITFTTGLVPGTYSYQLKGPRSLANSGTLTISTGQSNAEFGNELAGDANGDNIVNSIDFNILKSVFGQPSTSADFDNDGLVNSVDFNLLKSNFGQQGATYSCP